MSEEADAELNVQSPGIASSRSRRTKKDKYGRSAALQKLKESKSTGQRIKYEVSEIENVYDELNEGDYCDKVQQRLEDDWIVDDGAGDYVEDGREIFDEEINAPEQNKTSKKTIKPTNKKKIKLVKSSDIKNMLLSSGAKKKVEKNIDLSNDALLGDILQEINTQSSDVLSAPRPPVVLRKKKKFKPNAIESKWSPQTSSAATTSNVMSQPSSLQKKMKPRKIVAPVPAILDSPSHNEPCVETNTPPAKRTKLDLDNAEFLN
uniref:DNA polymerase alpha catalytic subunit n=1 Tax=Ciona intestinalis TaxID=7719 RepID=UPI00089DB258